MQIPRGSRRIGQQVTTSLEQEPSPRVWNAGRNHLCKSLDCENTSMTRNWLFFLRARHTLSRIPSLLWVTRCCCRFCNSQISSGSSLRFVDVTTNLHRRFRLKPQLAELRWSVDMSKDLNNTRGLRSKQPIEVLEAALYRERGGGNIFQDGRYMARKAGQRRGKTIPNLFDSL